MNRRDLKCKLKKTLDTIAILHYKTYANKATSKGHKYNSRLFFQHGFLDSSMTLEQFKNIKHNTVIKTIYTSQTAWKTPTRQKIAHWYLSFTRFIQNYTNGYIKEAKHLKTKTFDTREEFYKTCTTRALTSTEIQNFFTTLQEPPQIEPNNPRSACYLAAILLFQGARRVSEVVALNIGDIDWKKNQITFAVTKNKLLPKNVLVTYPQNVFQDLKTYLGNRLNYNNPKSQPLFISMGKKYKKKRTDLRKRRRIQAQYIRKVFRETFKRAGIQNVNRPTHVFRVKAVTLLRDRGVGYNELQDLTCHHSPEFIDYYDYRRDKRASNASRNLLDFMPTSK